MPSGVRARGSAQHPIALSAALVMLVPLAFYLYQRYRRYFWLGCAGDSNLYSTPGLGSIGDANAEVTVRLAATRAKRSERISFLLEMVRRTNARLSLCPRKS